MQRFITIFALLLAVASAFAPPSAFVGTSRAVVPSTPMVDYQPPALQRQRKSVANVQTMSLFGLGPAELAIIGIAAAFLLGPQKLAELGKDAGKIAGELKEVPKEFQKGLAEGEEEAKSMKQSITGETKAAAKDAEKE
mmetsp:Transcript_23186/g.38371  ORF Transcript_23186/g.38371 Transcript_23186/m.38371 type:complete len:138 (-) Transcript_23186:143-556(-)|eukprot:CAMPEP_0119012632 /NCGR_PEP_ID=MMETSP1176-20130426/7112_1 /TAXON_ID=265551 /ORGANISM="Synedropsis recta cf, Strain CCMP1620" /LENGTH=137 /DNA_ID=CAMNT_0006965629 /DNA_START=45 /DNA_END=458 /DNA_ORIENTATION=+